jgi:hypothetical protein
VNIGTNKGSFKYSCLMQLGQALVLNWMEQDHRIYSWYSYQQKWLATYIMIGLMDNTCMDIGLDCKYDISKN